MYPMTLQKIFFSIFWWFNEMIVRKIITLSHSLYNFVLKCIFDTLKYFKIEIIKLKSLVLISSLLVKYVVLLYPSVFHLFISVKSIILIFLIVMNNFNSCIYKLNEQNLADKYFGPSGAQYIAYAVCKSTVMIS